jgi:predicted metalloprotease with PDZ domain
MKHVATSLVLLFALAPPGVFAASGPQGRHAKRPKASAPAPDGGVSAFEAPIAEPKVDDSEPPALKAATANFDERAQAVDRDSAKLAAMQKEFDKEMAADATKIAGDQPKTAQQKNAAPASDETPNSLGLSFETSDSAGVRVLEVGSGTPAGKAGLKAGDVITRWNGKPVHSLADLREQLRGTSGEKSIRVEIVRNGLNQAVSIDRTDPQPAKAADLDSTVPMSQ